MAKRFTDTEKWRDDWWGSLTNDYRMIWLYLVDSCSIAGIWKKDFRGLNFNCNTNITEEDFLKVFGSRMIDCKSFYFIPKFLLFQYPKGLNSDKPAIVSIRNEVLLNNLSGIIKESLPNGFLTIKDKDKDKDKDTDNRQEQRQRPKITKFVGEKSEFSISIAPKYLEDVPIIIYDLEKYFSDTMQLDQMKLVKLNRFADFMRDNPAAVFSDPSHLYNSFRAYHTKNKSNDETKRTTANAIIKPTGFGKL